MKEEWFHKNLFLLYFFSEQDNDKERSILKERWLKNKLCSLCLVSIRQCLKQMKVKNDYQNELFAIISFLSKKGSL